MAVPDLSLLAVLQRRGWTDHRTLRQELKVGYNSFYPRLVQLCDQHVVERRTVRKYGYNCIVEWRLTAVIELELSSAPGPPEADELGHSEGSGTE